MKPSIEKADGLLTYLAAARHRRRWLIAAFVFGLTVTILLARCCRRTSAPRAPF